MEVAMQYLQSTLRSQTKKSEALQSELTWRTKQLEDLQSKLTLQTKKSEDLQSNGTIQRNQSMALQSRLTLETKKSEDLQCGLTLQTKKSEDLQSRLTLQTEKSDDLQSRLTLQTEKSEDLQSRLTLQTEKSKELQSRLNFLRQRFDKANADGARKADVSFLVQDRKDEVLYAHKFVLAGKSPVFCKMFEINMLESKTGFVRIDDATLPVMRAVIEFCYSAEVDFTDEVTLEDVLEVAHKYGIDFLVKTCEELLIQTIDKVNLPRRLKLSKKFEAKMLHARSLEYLKAHFDDVIVSVVDELF